MSCKLLFVLRIRNTRALDEDFDIALFVSEPSNRAGMIVDRIRMLAEFRRQLSTGLPSLTILDETFETMHFSVMLTRFLPYSAGFMARINEMISNGLAKKFSEETLFVQDPHRKAESVPPQVLALEHLALGFFIFLIATGLSIVAFLVEVLIAKFREKIPSRR
jgi:hypothetical protein